MNLNVDVDEIWYSVGLEGDGITFNRGSYDWDMALHIAHKLAELQGKAIITGVMENHSNLVVCREAVMGD